MVMPIVGAGGNTQRTLPRRGCKVGSVSARLDQPAGVSPRPCRKMSAAGPEDDALVETVRVDNDEAVLDIMVTNSSTSINRQLGSTIQIFPPPPPLELQNGILSVVVVVVVVDDDDDDVGNVVGVVGVVFGFCCFACGASGDRGDG